jgi:type I restriction enzyme S subunit
MKWPLVKLGDIAPDMQPGFAMQPAGEYVGIPHLRTNNVSEDGHLDLSSIKRVRPTKDQIAKYSLAHGDILFNNTNSPVLVGKTAFFEGEGQFLFSNHMTRIRVNAKVADPRFIARYLHWIWDTGGFRAMVTQWVNQAAINRSQLARLCLSLPPLSEQQRIVTILDQAYGLRKKRAEADAKAERIIPALFTKIFGDPSTNPMGWEKGRLGAVIEETQYGTSARANTEGKGIVVIRMNNIDSLGRIDLSDLKNIVLDTQDEEKYRLGPGDLLFNRTNSRELVGKTGLWRSEIEAVPASYLIRVRVNRELAIPEYIWAYMNTAFIKQALFEKARRAIGMANINAQELRSLPVMIPDTKMQHAFAQLLADVDHLAESLYRTKEKLDQLFQTLLHRAFCSELTATWREGHMEELLAEMEEQARHLAADRRHDQKENAAPQESLF